MKTYDKFKEYIWMVNTIREARRITLEEINEKWLDTDMGEVVEMARSTLARHKIAMYPSVPNPLVFRISVRTISILSSSSNKKQWP